MFCFDLCLCLPSIPQKKTSTSTYVRDAMLFGYECCSSPLSQWWFFRGDFLNTQIYGIYRWNKQCWNSAIFCFSTTLFCTSRWQNRIWFSKFLRSQGREDPQTHAEANPCCQIFCPAPWQPYQDRPSQRQSPMNSRACCSWMRFVLANSTSTKQPSKNRI